MILTKEEKYTLQIAVTIAKEHMRHVETFAGHDKNVQRTVRTIQEAIDLLSKAEIEDK